MTLYMYVREKKNYMIRGLGKKINYPYPPPPPHLLKSEMAGLLCQLL